MIETKIYFSFENLKQLNDIIDYVNTVLENYTLYETIGYYKGLSEPSRIIEIISEPYYNLNSLIFEEIIITIKSIANQESVLITNKSVDVELI